MSKPDIREETDNEQAIAQTPDPQVKSSEPRPKAQRLIAARGQTVREQRSREQRSAGTKRKITRPLARVIFRVVLIPELTPEDQSRDELIRNVQPHDGEALQNRVAQRDRRGLGSARPLDDQLHHLVEVVLA